MHIILIDSDYDMNTFRLLISDGLLTFLITAQSLLDLHYLQR